ncbi:helix-turn-helix transcriptional regulator [Fictibacillus enclensis]|uniref:helix-turn-helix domain-containing protein n=1 Tax=Fictibacillus enclensis TaxID=1017270 RepID=UPI0025A08941|nr:helix-turn-helix transcriptional regulator [Fictibacillus enclensis]MDM5197863.1 helix-turn-helix transcriptional regulator [Fictibacillus enclensis]
MKIVRSNLKSILDSKGISIRQLAERTELQFETLRRMYNDDTKQYNKVMLAKICEDLEIEISDLLLLEEHKK